jgi:hypothetical protein
MYEKDLTRKTTLFISRFSLSNFGLGFDFYKMYDLDTEKHVSSVLQISLLVCNITFNFWKDDLSQWR